jgi:hypothetical protein
MDVLVQVGFANLALTPILAAFWWRSSRPRAGLILGAVVFLDGVWASALLLAFSGWRHADGFMDCWPSCTAGQDATRVILLGTPVLMAPIGIVLLVALARRALTRSS